MRTLAALLLCVAPAAAIAQDGGNRAFEDWTAACDASGYCSANAVSQPTDGRSTGEYVLTVGRHAQQPYWEVSFATMGAASADQWADFTVSVDGAPQVFSLPGEVGAYGQGNHFYFLGEGAQAVMDRFTPGTAVTVAFTDTAQQPKEAGFSLAGLTAALLWIDEQQARLGSERVAAAPPHGLVPLYAGGVAPEVPLALLDRHRADPDCQPFEELANGRDIVSDDLGDGYTLYMLPCQSGAYNFAQKVFLGSGGDYFDPQFFADYQAGIGWLGTPYMWNAGYDKTTKSISTFAKARGVGDCGTIAQWQWNGYLFQLMEMRARACTDDIDPDAEMPEFPVVYSGELFAPATP